MLQRFSLGRIVITPAALDALISSGQSEELSIEKGFRILRVYKTVQGEKLLVITEADHRVITLILPSED